MSGSQPVAALIRREWLVVLVAAILGVAVSFALSNRAPEASYSATQRVTVVGLASALANPPKAEALLAAGTLGSVRRSAEESLGLDAGALAGSTSVELDKKDKTTVIFKANAATAEDAEKRVAALSAASIDHMLLPLRVYMQLQDEAAKQVSERLPELNRRVARLEKQVGSGSPLDRATFEQALSSAISQRDTAEDEVRGYRHNKRQVENAFVADEAFAAKVGTAGMQVSTILQGLLLGIVAGVAVAAVREYFISRREA